MISQDSGLVSIAERNGILIKPDNYLKTAEDIVDLFKQLGLDLGDEGFKFISSIRERLLTTEVANPIVAELSQKLESAGTLGDSFSFRKSDIRRIIKKHLVEAQDTKTSKPLFDYVELAFAENILDDYFLNGINTIDVNQTNIEIFLDRIEAYKRIPTSNILMSLLNKLARESQVVMGAVVLRLNESELILNPDSLTFVLSDLLSTAHKYKN